MLDNQEFQGQKNITDTKYLWSIHYMLIHISSYITLYITQLWR